MGSAKKPISKTIAVSTAIGSFIRQEGSDGAVLPETSGSFLSATGKQARIRKPKI